MTSGNILIGDRVVNDVAPKDRDIAMVFQSYALYPHMTVFDNMGFGLTLRHVPKPQIEKGSQSAAKMLELKLCSSGNRVNFRWTTQRVAWDEPSFREPKVFLLMNPTNWMRNSAFKPSGDQQDPQRLQRPLFTSPRSNRAMTMATRIA